MAKVTKKRVIKLTPTVRQKLEQAFALDCTVEEACFYAKISKQTYYNWIDSFPELLESFDVLRNKPILKARQTVVNSLDNPDYAFKYLERKRRSEFGANIDLTSKNEKLVKDDYFEAVRDFHKKSMELEEKLKKVEQKENAKNTKPTRNGSKKRANNDGR